MDLFELWRYLQVGLGIGLVIFVHEAGHFIAARLCKVRVEVFSLGFGPKLLGWRRGGTLYQLAAVPFGGYVRMAGDEGSARSEHPAPDELRSKSVGQRFFIYSGGVLMNVVFGLVVFPMVLARGVPFTEPLIGQSLPGGPAWQAGLVPGTRVLAVNGKPVVSFNYIDQEVALGPPEGSRLLIQEPGASAPREVFIEARYLEEFGFRSILVAPAFDALARIEVDRDSPADKAGLRAGDRLLGVVGAAPELDLSDQLLDIMRTGGTLELLVEREGQRSTVVVAPDSKPGGPPRLGVSPIPNHVTHLRGSAAGPGAALRVGDRILSAGERTIVHPLDLRLALLEAAGGAQPLVLRILREGALLEVPLQPLDAAEALALSSDIALSADVQATHVAVTPGSPAAQAGLQDGDRIVSIAGAAVERWEDITRLAKQHARDAEGMTLEVLRPGPEREGPGSKLELRVRPAPIAADVYGFGVLQSRYIYKADSLGQAIRVGFKSSWKFVVDAWSTLRRIVGGDVSGENIGGIITIGAVSYSWAGEGLAKLLFFLCMLSLNLAFLNVLPIPVLDGGHLFFLLVEKIKGSPVDERVFGYSQMVGLVLILSLMIYVTYNDLMRWVFS